MKKVNAKRPECKKCVSNKDGECIALRETRFDRECPFLATPERLARDKEILLKAIMEGRVSESSLLYDPFVK